MRKVKAAFLISVMISVAFIMPNPLVVSAQSGPVLIRRGQNYETWQMNATHFMWVSAPPWVWDVDSGKYVPYIFEDYYAEAGYYLMRNAHITVRLYRDHAEFWNVNYTEIQVRDERWFPQYYDGEWRSLDAYNPTFSVITNTSGIFITESWALGPPISADEAFKVTYALRVARPLKSFVALNNKGAETYEFRLIQTLDGIAASNVKCSEGAIEMASPVSTYSTWFQFSSDTNDLVFFHDLRLTGYYDERRIYHNDVLQPATIILGQRGLTASFTYSNRSLYTLGPGEIILLDPEERTFYNDDEVWLSGCILAESWGYWPPPYKTAYPGCMIEVGKQKIPPYHYELWRGYVSFYTGGEEGIQEDAIIDEAELRVFMYWHKCEGENGGPGSSFGVEFYSGMDEWDTTLNVDCWDDCTKYEGWLLIDPWSEDDVWCEIPVETNSIAYLGNGNVRTQFRLVHWNEFDPPADQTAIQLCLFDNYFNIPQLHVIWHT